MEYDIKDFYEPLYEQKYRKLQLLERKISLVDAEVIDNPLLKLKNKVINKRIAEEIQPFVYRALATAFYITNSYITYIILWLSIFWLRR